MARRDNVSELKSQLTKEKDRANDLTVRIQELENKLSLVRDGVPVETFDTPGMDIIHQIKLQKKLVDITKNVKFADIQDHLIQDGVLARAHVQNIASKPADRDQMSELVNDYLVGPDAYQCFRNALKEGYEYIVKALDTFVVKKEDIQAPTTTPIPRERPSTALEVRLLREQIQVLQKQIQRQGSPRHSDSDSGEKNPTKLVQKLKDDFRQQLEEKSAEIETLRKSLAEQTQTSERYTERIHSLTETLGAHESRIGQLEGNLTQQKQSQKNALNALEKRLITDLNAVIERRDQGADVNTLLQMMSKGERMQRELIDGLKENMEESLGSVKHSIEDMRSELQQSQQQGGATAAPGPVSYFSLLFINAPSKQNLI